MVHYKLEYFDIRGLAGIEYENVIFKIGDPEWPAYKESTPLGRLPVLTIDGFKIPQSAAINRYLARKFGYAGKTPEEAAWVDAIVDQFKDFLPCFMPVVLARRHGKPEDKFNKIPEEVFIPGKDAYFEALNKILSKSKSGFLVGDGLTFADLLVVDGLTSLEKMGLYTPSEQPKLEALHKKVTSTPALKKWIKKRPDTPV